MCIYCCQLVPSCLIVQSMTGLQGLQYPASHSGGSPATAASWCRAAWLLRLTPMRNTAWHLPSAASAVFLSHQSKESQHEQNSNKCLASAAVVWA